MYDVKAGVASVFHPISNPKESDCIEDINMIDDAAKIEKSDILMSLANSTTFEMQESGLPSSIRFHIFIYIANELLDFKTLFLCCDSVSIALRYDNRFLGNTCNGDHTLAQARAREIVSLAQPFFQDPTLGTSIELKIVSVKYVNTDARAGNM